MKNIKVVIGANFGDEGKGLMTDYFASRINGKGIVVRFNGGAQAGHTVTTADGNRHVFGHIGSGSFAGLPTYLSSYFVTNPMLLNKELNSLNMMKMYPEIYIDGRCLVSTPYDMLINQIVEIVRGDSKHGSCGLGFNETINRSLNAKDFGLCINDLMDETLLRERLYSIKNVYVPNRLKELNIEDMPERYLDLLKDDGIIESYIDDVKGMLSLVTVANIDMITEFDSILFEGAQGLLLDQNHKYFPHVTRSNTGIKNVVQLIKEIGLEEENIEIVYVTRAYLTRHGVGPFPTELPSKPYSQIKDSTNIPNIYQDALRFGLLDLDVLAQTISKDLENIRSLNTLKYNVKLAITCLDQLDETVDYIINSKEVKTSVDEFIYKALDIVNVKSGYGSYGVTRATVLSIS